MISTKVLVVLCCLVGLSHCGIPSYGVRYKQPIFAYAAEDHPVINAAPDQPLLKPISGSYDHNSVENNGPPTPYQFGYQIKDDEGATQHRQESGDENGVVKGSYGYTDPFGVYRQVHYVADAGGFRAVIKTNEPGTSNDSPADVQIQAEDPPAVVQEKTIHASASKINIPVGIRPGYSEPYPNYAAPHYVAPRPSVGNYGYAVPVASVPVAKIVPVAVSTRHSYRKSKPLRASHWGY